MRGKVATTDVDTQIATQVDSAAAPAEPHTPETSSYTLAGDPTPPIPETPARFRQVAPVASTSQAAAGGAADQENPVWYYDLSPR